MRELSELPKKTLTKEQEDVMLSQLWQNDAFTKHVAERDLKLIFTMAGGEGMEAEPRDRYIMHTGQRVENLLLARDAKAAYNRVQMRMKEKVALTQTQDK